MNGDQIDRLRNLARTLRKLNPEQFDIHGWLLAQSGARDIVGCASREPWCYGEGFHVSLVDGRTTWRGLQGVYAISAFFGIPSALVEPLFSPDGYKHFDGTVKLEPDKYPHHMWCESYRERLATLAHPVREFHQSLAGARDRFSHLCDCIGTHGGSALEEQMEWYKRTTNCPHPLPKGCRCLHFGPSECARNQLARRYQRGTIQWLRGMRQARGDE